jgi:hypothetical protein
MDRLHKCRVRSELESELQTNNQAYPDMIGNGWTVEVIKHIFSFLPDEFKHEAASEQSRMARISKGMP